MNRTPLFRPAHRLAISALAAGTLIAALAPVTTAASASERSAPPAVISWAACGTQLECARVSVPLDGAHRGGRPHGTACPSDHVPFDPDFGQGAAVR